MVRAANVADDEIGGPSRRRQRAIQIGGQKMKNVTAGLEADGPGRSALQHCATVQGARGSGLKYPIQVQVGGQIISVGPDCKLRIVRKVVAVGNGVTVVSAGGIG